MASPMRKRKRQSYTAEFKQSVVKHAEENGNREAGRIFEVDEKSVRQWRQKKDELSLTPRSKRARRSGITKWPKLEDELKQWINGQRESGRSVSTVMIRLKAQSLSKQLKCENFIGGPSWCYRFMKRNGLSVRNRTTVGQALPDDWENKVSNFVDFIKRSVSRLSLESGLIGNMDEVPMSFDAPPNRTVDAVGVKSVNVVTTGHEKTHFTVVLSCLGDGTKLRPMVIFKRQTIPKENFPSGIVVRCNKKGWMNENEMSHWIDGVWRRRPGTFFTQKNSLLVMDSMTAHKQDCVKQELKKLNTDIAIIPGGLTKKLQPLDLTVNRVFKVKVREQWEQWMSDGIHTYTGTGRMRKASHAEVCRWVVNAWESVQPSMIVKAFYKAGILPGVYYHNSDSSDDNVPLSELRSLSKEQIEMFQSESEDTDFDGW
jgi:transposase-like protein